jgi:hypothetical protein
LESAVAVPAAAAAGATAALRRPLYQPRQDEAKLQLLWSLQARLAAKRARLEAPPEEAGQQADAHAAQQQQQEEEEEEQQQQQQQEQEQQQQQPPPAAEPPDIQAAMDMLQAFVQRDVGRGAAPELDGLDLEGGGLAVAGSGDAAVAGSGGAAARDEGPVVMPGPPADDAWRRRPCRCPCCFLGFQTPADYHVHTL